MSLKSSSNSSSSGKAIGHDDDLTAKSKLLDKIFLARFVYGKLQDLFVDENDVIDGDVALLNLRRALVSILQVTKRC